MPLSPASLIFQVTHISTLPYSLSVQRLRPLPLKTKAPSSTFQLARMFSSASACALARSSGESAARLSGLSFGPFSRPRQPVRSLPLKAAVKPIGGVLSDAPAEASIVLGFLPL